MNRKSLTLLLILPLVALLAACGGGREFHKNPLDVMVRDLTEAKTFSIILYDMDVEGNFSKTYKHQYRIVKEMAGDTIPTEEITDWMTVNEDFFWEHENDMGMEVASKGEDGKVHKVTGPPGYSQYVGNERYGRWRNDGGSRFWEFYGQYAFMRSMFGYGMRPIYYRDYNTYYSSYRYQKPYYGSKTKSGNNSWGTYSDHSRKSNPNFFERKSRKSNWSKSSNRSTSRSRSGSRSRSSSSRSRSSGYRSRSRGFGK